MNKLAPEFFKTAAESHRARFGHLPEGNNPLLVTARRFLTNEQIQEILNSLTQPAHAN